MHLYPANLYSKLEFDSILKQLENFCLGALGRNKLSQLKIIKDHTELTKEYTLLTEFIEISNKESFIQSCSFEDLKELIKLLNKVNAFLTAEEFRFLFEFLTSVNLIYRFFYKHKEDTPFINSFLNETEFKPELAELIDDVVDEEKNIKSSASPELKKIRKEISKTQQQLDKNFEQILTYCKKNYKLGEGEESIRNGRRVIALNAEFKRSLKGIIHDESATGKTVFIEPEQIVELSNEMFELKQAEKRESIRILKKLTTQLKPFTSLIFNYQEIAGEIDFLHAKTRLAKKLKAIVPEITEKPYFKVFQARHPILFVHNLELKKNTVPFDLELDGKKRILVISGPNAGGKSVCMKSCGLLQLMVQSAFPVPVEQGSVFGMFDSFFADIGDEQSIENDLSTYSSHLKNMDTLTRKAKENSFFLIDEFGSGTDPGPGGAIAEAILETLSKSGAYGIITTHYANIKMKADKLEAVFNAAMGFDNKALKPLYTLHTGQPGASFAFDIALKTGIDQSIIKRAKNLSDKNFVKTDRLLADLLEQRRKLNISEKQIKEKEKHFQALINTYETLKTDLNKNKSRILKEYKDQMFHSLTEMNKKYEQLIKEIREYQKSFNEGNQVKKQDEIIKSIQKDQKQISENINLLKITEKEEVTVKAKSLPQIVEKGSWVCISDGNEAGQVKEIRKSRAVVEFGQIKTIVDIKALKVVASPEAAKSKSESGFSWIENAIDFPAELDIRGYREDEAMKYIEKVLDTAHLSEKKQIRIIHGKGEGILRKSIRALLKKYDFVDSFSSELPQFGGDGVTVVEFR